MNIRDFFKRKNKDTEVIKKDIEISKDAEVEKKDVLTKEEFEKISALLFSGSFVSKNFYHNEFISPLKHISRYDDYLESINSEKIKKDSFEKVKELCDFLEIPFNGSIPTREEIVPYICKKYDVEKIQYDAEKIQNQLAIFFKTNNYSKKYGLEPRNIDEFINIEEFVVDLKNKIKEKEYNELRKKLDNEDRMRAADTMARKKEIEAKEKRLKEIGVENVLNKMLRIINGSSDEKLSNEELSLLYGAGELTEERMEALYVYGYDLSFLDEEKSEGRTR